MLPNPLLSDLIGTIYDCAVDPGLWPGALEAVRDLLSYHNATLSAFDLPSGTQFLGINVGIPPEWEATMGEYGPDIVAMWGGRERVEVFPLGEPIVLSHVAGNALHTNRYYREWKLPQGSTDTVMIGLARDTTFMAGIGLGRHYAKPPIDEVNLAALRLLAPHFRRAVVIGRLLDHHRREAGTLTETLDALPNAILLVDPMGRIVRANDAAGRLLNNPTACSATNGIFTLSDAAANKMLHAAIATAGGREANLGRASIPARGRSGGAIVIHLLPLRPEGARSSLAPGAVAALFITPSPNAGPVPGEALALLYDLTPAETGIMERLTQGHTTTEIAAILGIAPSTIKTHLLRLFAKTGCKRQIDLVNLVRSFRGPI